MTDKEILHAKLQSKITMPIGDVLSDAFDLFGKGAGKYIGFILLMFFALMGVGIVTSIVSLVSPVLGVILMLLIAIVVSPAIQVGFGRFTKKLKENNDPQFSDFFSGFKYNLSQLVLQSAVVMLISFAIGFGLKSDFYLAIYDLLMQFDGDFLSLAEEFKEIDEAYNKSTILSFLGGLFSFYIGLGLMLTPYIVSFYNVNAFTAMDVSFRTINKVVVNAGVIQIVLGVIAFMGVIVLLVGLLATIPILFIGSYLMFRYAIGEKPSAEASEFKINEHLQ